MRIIRYFTVAIGLLLLVSSCKKDNIEYIDILTVTTSFEIPAGLDPIQTHYIEIPNVITRLEELLESRQLTFGDIQAIQPRFAQMTSFPSVENFDFLRVSALEIGNQQNDFIEAFYIDRIPNNEDSILDYIPNEVNLKSRFDASRINARVVFQLKNNNTTTFRSNIEMSFFIQ